MSIKVRNMCKFMIVFVGHIYNTWKSLDNVTKSYVVATMHMQYFNTCKQPSISKSDSDLSKVRVHMLYHWIALEGELARFTSI